MTRHGSHGLHVSELLVHDLGPDGADGRRTAALVDDLVAESAALYGVLDGLRPAQWSLPTPAAGWSLGDHVSHLAYFDGTTLQSLVDPEQFRRDAER